VKVATISVIIMLVALLEIARTIRRASHDRMGIRVAAVWIVLWAAAGFFALFPDLLGQAVSLAQMGDRTFFITVVGLLVLFTIVFDHVEKLEVLRRDMARLVQENALLRARVDGDVVSSGPYARTETNGDSSPGQNTRDRLGEGE